MYKKILSIMLLILCFGMTGCTLFENLGINIMNPGDLGVLLWPETELTKMIPNPTTESQLGRIDELTDKTFCVYVGNIPEVYYSEYVNQCIFIGFNKKLSFKNNIFNAMFAWLMPE